MKEAKIIGVPSCSKRETIFLSMLYLFTHYKLNCKHNILGNKKTNFKLKHFALKKCLRFQIINTKTKHIAQQKRSKISYNMSHYIL